MLSLKGIAHVIYQAYMQRPEWSQTVKHHHHEPGEDPQVIITEVISGYLQVNTMFSFFSLRYTRCVLYPA